MARTVKIDVNGEKLTVQVPSAPAVLPNDLKGKWEEAYIGAFKEAAEDQSRGESERYQFALREANRVLKVGDLPKNYEEAVAFPAWKAHSREEVEITVASGKDSLKKKVLKLVTIDGRKASFDVPSKAEKQKTA
jgi:hypothetical protein